MVSVKLLFLHGRDLPSNVTVVFEQAVNKQAAMNKRRCSFKFLKWKVLLLELITLGNLTLVIGCNKLKVLVMLKVKVKVAALLLNLITKAQEGCWFLKEAVFILNATGERERETMRMKSVYRLRFLDGRATEIKVLMV